MTRRAWPHRRICTLLGHDWDVTYREGRREVQQCQRCGRRISTMYDMLTGQTYWEVGDWWSRERRTG